MSRGAPQNLAHGTPKNGRRRIREEAKDNPKAVNRHTQKGCLSAKKIISPEQKSPLARAKMGQLATQRMYLTLAKNVRDHAKKGKKIREDTPQDVDRRLKRECPKNTPFLAFSGRKRAENRRKKWDALKNLRFPWHSISGKNMAMLQRCQAVDPVHVMPLLRFFQKVTEALQRQ